jgi:hypothetical protein
LEGDKSNEGMVNIMKVHYMHICNYHSEWTLFVQLMYALEKACLANSF